jgi:mRNA interferase RelE/StbE
LAEYSVEFVNSAAKEFRSLPADIKQRIGLIIDSLHKNPLPSGVRKLFGYKRLYRIRVGHYRVIYEIHDQEKLIRVTRIRHRREAYR